MASNRFGSLFCVTTWGESHGKAIGLVIDGCPAGLHLTDAIINEELSIRRPGKLQFTSERKEEDIAEIYSGVFEGKTTGSPISIIIFNRDVKLEDYEAQKELLRPGHANYTYLQKYGLFDYRGSGRASARETACRVAAGAVAKQILREYDIHLAAFLKEMGGVEAYVAEHEEIESLKEKTLASPLFCPDSVATQKMITTLASARMEGDSIGGIVELRAEGMPTGLGDPLYEKLEAKLGLSMLSIPASKGFEIGSGFTAARMKGSEHNDLFVHNSSGKIITRTNHAGGVLAGISTGMPLVCRVAFKPASTIGQPQSTLDREGHAEVYEPSGINRHDPCVAIRAVPVVEAMAALVLVDALLMHRMSRLHPEHALI